MKSASCVRIIVVYRPSPSAANDLSVMQLLIEFSVFLWRLLLLPAELHILGDFNFYINDMADRDAWDFIRLLDTFNLVQHVSGSKHGSNHIFDLLISRENSSIIKDINVFPANLMIV